MISSLRLIVIIKYIQTAKLICHYQLYDVDTTVDGHKIDSKQTRSLTQNYNCRLAQIVVVYQSIVAGTK